MRRLLIGIIIVPAVLVAAALSWGTSRPPMSLAEKVQTADAIVMGTVARLETKRYGLTLYKKGSDGKTPAMRTWYDLAVLHPERVLKSDTTSMVNKVDASNPMAWMHMAFASPEQPLEEGIDQFPSPDPVAREGQRQIWFLRRDLILTGHYFIRDIEPVTDENVGLVERMLGERSQR